MRKKKKGDYLVFPIQLLQNAIPDTDSFIQNVMSYCVCRRYHELIDCYDNETPVLGMIENYFELDSNQVEECLFNGESTYEEYKDKNVPLVIISQDVFRRFRNSRNREKETPEMLGYMALKSIIGNDKYTHTTNEFLKIRMSGLVSFDDKFMIPKEIDELSKYKLKKIKDNIEVKFGAIIHDARPHGFFYSFSMTDDELNYETIVRSMKYKLQKRKEEKNISLKNTIEKLKNMPKNKNYEMYQNDDTGM